MGFLDRLLGREARETYPPPASGAGYAAQPAGGASPDERAVARYRYLLRTAPPESLEQVHAEAFAQLNPEQRRQVLAELSRDLPAGEQAPSDDPQSMARFATRAELRRPGYLEQAFGRRTGGGGMGMGMGGTVMGSMMGTMAGVVVGSMVANALLDDYDSSPEASEVGDGGAAADGSDSSGDSGDSAASGDSNDTGATGDASGDTSAAADPGYDSGGQESGGYDAGGFDSGGFGGGDFGGGSDFGGGGGDFGGGF